MRIPRRAASPRRGELARLQRQLTHDRARLAHARAELSRAATAKMTSPAALLAPFAIGALTAGVMPGALRLLSSTAASTAAIKALATPAVRAWLLRAIP